MRVFCNGFLKGEFDPLYSFWGVPQGKVVVRKKAVAVVSNVDQAIGLLTPFVKRGDLSPRDFLRIIDRMRGEGMPEDGIHLLEIIRQLGAACAAHATQRGFILCTEDHRAPPHGVFSPWPTAGFSVRLRSVGAGIGRVRLELARAGTDLTVEEGTWLVSRALAAGLNLKRGSRPLGHTLCLNPLDAIAHTFVRQG